MKKNESLYLVIFFILALSLSGYAQSLEEKTTKKGSLYFNWGYNRSFFSTSDIHFEGPGYDFTLKGVQASDRPSPFGSDYYNPTKFTIPQYVYRIGYFITDKIAISVGGDHLKYVVDQNQSAKISGYINANASTKYRGAYQNDEVIISDDFLQFEHSDGLNLVSIDLEYLLPLYKKSDKRFSLFLNSGVGGIWVVTKTKVSIFQDGLDNKFNLSGYHLGLKLGPRIEYKNRLFLMGEIKTGYATLNSIPLKGDAPDQASHDVRFLEYYFAIGYNFKI